MMSFSCDQVARRCPHRPQFSQQALVGKRACTSSSDRVLCSPWQSLRRWPCWPHFQQRPLNSSELVRLLLPCWTCVRRAVSAAYLLGAPVSHRFAPADPPVRLRKYLVTVPSPFLLGPQGTHDAPATPSPELAVGETHPVDVFFPSATPCTPRPGTHFRSASLTPQPPQCMSIVGSPSCVPGSPALARTNWPRAVVLSPGHSSPLLERAAQTVPAWYASQAACPLTHALENPWAHKARAIPLHPRRPPPVQRKRVCAGESLARMELYIITSMVFQNFSIAPAPGESINLTPNLDAFFFRKPMYNEFIFSMRK
ncbi:hypothetical protein E2C01_046454 [Portunus trituberculatus]|uniref:Uncharacterized protein n=1 Tax=Portunus trituberculatus TaxID=210409 RepID=A0A5B7G115_PORTR|nr:hypothetical protein [Portunus trituberculatus]